MQELLDELKEYQLEFNIPIEVIDMCESQLNVEKEQIMNAHNNAVISPYTELYVHKIQGKSPITKGEEYYNKRYNQNN